MIFSRLVFRLSFSVLSLSDRVLGIVLSVGSVYYFMYTVLYDEDNGQAG